MNDLVDIQDQTARELDRQHAYGALPEDTALAIREAEAKAVQEVQAALVIAKRFPRDENQAQARILQACRRKSLAEVAVYSLPRGNQRVTGPSIRLAETLAKAWGNLDFGIKEIESTPDYTVVEAYCWDLETNVQRRRRLTVQHRIKLRSGQTKHLTDPKEISEMVGSFGQRQVRQCILSVIPGDVVESAIQQCKATLTSGGEPLAERVSKMLVAFSELGVKKEEIEKFIGRPVQGLTPEQLVDLQHLYVSLKEGTAHRAEVFGETKEEEKSSKTQSLNEKLK